MSCATSASHASMNVSTGSSGIASRRAEDWKRRALASGRKVATEPSGWRYALRPSKIVCA